MSTRLFGTDGVRGTAGAYPLDHADGAAHRRGARARAAGRAAARVLIGRDTRESGLWIERELAHGARACGAEVVSAGVIPTPGVAYLTRSSDFTPASSSRRRTTRSKTTASRCSPAAAKSSARSSSGTSRASSPTPRWEVPPGEADAVPGEALVERVPRARARGAARPGRTGRRARGVDCANGATTSVAPRLFRELGFDVTLHRRRARRPEHQPALRIRRIPRQLARTVLEGGYRLGVAFDGDGDRAIFVDERGRVVDGDAVMLMCARQLQAEGRLKGNAVVATVMSNIGLELALARERHHPRALPGRRQVRDGGAAASATCRSAASSRVTSSSPTTCSPATAWSPRSRCCA